MEALTSAQKAAIIISSIGTENASEVSSTSPMRR